MSKKNIFLNKLIVLILIFLFAGFIKAQNVNYTITGKILDKESKNVELGYVIALSKKDSVVISAKAFLEGEFILNGINQTPFILKVTAFGYKTTFLEVSNEKNDSVMGLDNIIIGKSEQILKEVDIVAKIPLFEDDGEKVKVNVESTSLSSSGTALDVLRQTPKVIIDNNENVSVFGKGTALIYMDGQLIASNDVLKSIPSTEIRNIEIISNPSAKYDANGRAVINIVTKRLVLKGYNGNIFQNLIYGKHLLSYEGFRFQFRRSKLAVTTTYGINPGKLWSSDEYTRNYSSNNSPTDMYNKIYTVTNNKNVNYYRLGLSYNIDSLSNVNFQYNGSYINNLDNVENTNIIYKDKAQQYKLQTITAGNYITLNNSGNINYSRKLDTLESEFSATAQYANFNSNNNESISQLTSVDTVDFQQNKRNISKNNIDLYTVQLSLDKSFGPKWKLETGIKEAYTNKTSEIKFDNYSFGEWIPDPNYYNGFLFEENIFASYLQMRYKQKKLNCRVGARYEYTTNYGFSKALNQRILSRQYSNLFPSAFVGYELSNIFSIALTYSSRISRPAYQDLDPFINYIDSLSSFRGNPYLKPEYTNAFELSFIYLKKMSLTLAYSRTDDAIKLTVDKLNNTSDAFIAMNKNLAKSEGYSVGLNIPYELPWWTTFNYFGYSLSSFTYGSSSVLIHNTQPAFNIYTYHEFRVKKLFSIEATFNYRSGGADGIFVLNRFYVLSANIKKKLFDDKLVIRFIANDILKSGYTSGNSNVTGYNVSFLSRVNSHYYMLSMSFRFGKLKNQDIKDKSINGDESDRIKTGKK
jgi:outer membrane receptor protein involved in Fe transport